MVREGVKNGRYRHGMTGTKIYYIWADMVGRCTRTTHARYPDYGGRGITVCERWLTFDHFFADMGKPPHGRSLDRLDNDSGYGPENCRWATPKEQRANRRPPVLRNACGAGHPYGENPPRTKGGKRRCRTCEARWAREGRDRKKVENA